MGWHNHVVLQLTIITGTYRHLGIKKTHGYFKKKFYAAGGARKRNPARHQHEMLHRQQQQEGKALESTLLEELEGTSGKQHVAKIL